MVRISIIGCVILLLISGVVPTWAQGPAANDITCSSSTACKKGHVAVFDSNGGAATVDDSIIKQSGSTVSVAGSETVTTNISAGGSISATGSVSGVSVSATGGVSGATVSATGSVSGATVSATGSISGATLTTTGNISAADVSATSNVSAGGNVTATGTVSGANVSATGTLSGGAVDATSGFDLGGAPFAFGDGGKGNAFLGFAGNTSTTGSFDTATGAGALQGNTSGSGDVAYGQAALVSNSSGYDNAAFGTDALEGNTTGAENTAVGVGALATGNGSELTCVGFNCSAAGPRIHNATAIGARALVSASNSLVLGSVAGVNGAKATTMVGIGTTRPTNLLTLGKGYGPSIADGWTTYSSRRWKTNIQPIHNALGVVEQLRGVTYNLKDSGKHEIGVIAEEVGAVVPEVVSYEDNGKDALGVDYSRLTALLIEATKEQQREIQQGQAELAKALRQIRQQQDLLRTQAAAMENLKAEVREDRESLRKVKTQIDCTTPTLVAAK